MRRSAPLRLHHRLDALNKLVADVQKTREMNVRTVGRSVIDQRSVGSVDVMLGRILAEVQRIRDGVHEDVQEIEQDDGADLAVLVRDGGHHV